MTIRHYMLDTHEYEQIQLIVWAYSCGYLVPVAGFNISVTPKQAGALWRSFVTNEPERQRRARDGH